MAQFSGTSNGGFQQLISKQAATSGSWFFGTEYSDNKPFRVGYYYFTAGGNNGDAMAVIATGILYGPGTELFIPPQNQGSDQHFSLWVRWDSAGQSWTVFT